MTQTAPARPVVLVTGVGRTVGIGAACAVALARDGWDVAGCGWSGYDARMPWGTDPDGVAGVRRAVEDAGGRFVAAEADLERPDAPAEVFDAVEAGLGPVTGLVMAHCESVDSDLRTTTVESFDRHYAVNLRATWLLVREYALRHRAPFGRGRVVALTSDHTVGNVPYGATKGAMDRVVLAAARELADLGVTANVVNPGPTQTGWMDDDLVAWATERSPLRRVGTPQDAAALVGWLCSPSGGWGNGQLLHSDGGLHA